ncbi:MAG: TrkH family potassium uptake protein, partial [Clostridia bacterium]|nr:TrkH family potassium uptake protein [Clostridia bacterium]
FCNAGFDLMGALPGDGSLTYFATDWLVNLTCILLITVGGLGYVVWDDLKRNRRHVGKYSAHTRLVLVANAILMLGGAGLFFLFEKHCTGQGQTAGDRLIESLFASATARTAGFNSVSVSGMGGASKLLTIFLMFIGGSPGSTAGGIKTTTVVVILFSVYAEVRKSDRIIIGKRRLQPGDAKSASAILALYSIMIIVSTIIICAIESTLGLKEIFYEVVSAICTVGLSLGITAEFSVFSKLIITLLMFVGRVGSVSVALALGERKDIPPVELPTEKIMIG